MQRLNSPLHPFFFSGYPDSDVSSDRDTVTAQTALTEIAGRGGPARDSVLAGKYRVENTLGFGGMGIVLRAHNIQLDEPVAIKVLREDVQIDDEHVERFLREAKAAVRLKSEHVAKIWDVGTLENGRPYIVMELLEGVDLGKLLVDMDCVEPKRAVELLLQACDAMAEAHANGIVHRDIKPTNLFLARRRDGSDLLKVLDFGISKAQSGPEMSLTQTSSMLGTPAYMSPEQMRSARTVDARSDIWALGTVLYELVEGRAPFEAQNFAELCVMVSTEPPAPMTRAPQLAPILDRCLQKSVDRRYQNVAELAADLQVFATDPVQAHRSVVRISRVLGVASRDSTPLPMQRQTSPRLPTTPSLTSGNAASTPLPSAVYDVPRRTGSLPMVLVLLLLFGIGIAGGLYVTRDTNPVAASEPQEPTEPTDVVLPATAPIDGGGAPADAAAAPTDATTAGSAAEPPVKTIKKDPPRRTPPRRTSPRPSVKPPVKPPVKVEATPPPTPPPPPVKKCDPFANPKGCR